MLSGKKALCRQDKHRKKRSLVSNMNKREKRNNLENPPNVLDIVHMLIDIKVIPLRLLQIMEPHEESCDITKAW
jgi:hypothetical protein